MTGNTKEAKKAAEEIISTTPFRQVQQDLIHEGIYYVLVEGGYHQEALTDAEVEFLAVKFIEEGIQGLENYVG